MKGKILFFVGICFSTSIFAQKIVPNSKIKYEIFSDSYSNDIPVGKCLVQGIILNQFDNDDNGFARGLSGGTISNLNRTNSVISNEEGFFSFLLDAKDTGVFFYKSGFEEIVIWNYNFRSQHSVIIYFVPIMETEGIDAPAKPVIYLYSDKKVNTEIQFTCSSNLTFTYPMYNNKWEINVDENGMTESKTGKKYPYLFWEAEPADLNFKIAEKSMNGFLISTDTVVNFLESSLTKLGLNDKEQADFITYWAPKLISKQFVLIQFLVDDDYTKYISQINVLPNPDAMRRIFMLFKPLDTNEIGMKVEPQELNSFERKAFTVVEWGGSEMSMSNLIP